MIIVVNQHVKKAYKNFIRTFFKEAAILTKMTEALGTEKKHGFLVSKQIYGILAKLKYVHCQYIISRIRFLLCCIMCLNIFYFTFSTLEVDYGDKKD